MNANYPTQRFLEIIEKASGEDDLFNDEDGTLSTTVHTGRTIEAFKLKIEFPNDTVLITTSPFMGVDVQNYDRVIGIRWGDIDFDKNEISINHDITYGPREKNGFKCDYEVGPPKTKAGIRTIPLMEKVKKGVYKFLRAGMDTKETIKKQFIGQKLYCKFIRR